MSTCLDTLLADQQRINERRAAPPPLVPASRADRLIAEGDRKRLAYRCKHPNADTAMTYGAQIGYLHAQIRLLCDEAAQLIVTRTKGTEYVTGETNGLGDVLVGYDFHRGQEAQTSGPPERCHDGTPDELSICEVWINGADIAAVLSERVLEEVTVAVQRHIDAQEEAARADAEDASAEARREWA